MSHAPTTDAEFLSTLEDWFRSQSEILVEIRYRCGGGSQDFELFSSFQALSDRIRELPAGACVTGFRTPQLPFRGVVNDDFVTKCLEQIPDGSEYLMAETVRRVYGRHSFFHCGSGESHAELRDDLEECRGAPVAAGLYPPVLEESANVVRAVVPDADGVVRAGPY
jgi:hypothetical protein